MLNAHTTHRSVIVASRSGVAAKRPEADVMRQVLADCVSAALFTLGRHVGRLAGKLARRRSALVLGFVAGFVKAYEAGEAPPNA